MRFSYFLFKSRQIFECFNKKVKDFDVSRETLNVSHPTYSKNPAKMTK